MSFHKAATVSLRLGVSATLQLVPSGWCQCDTATSAFRLVSLRDCNQCILAGVSATLQPVPSGWCQCDTATSAFWLVSVRHCNKCILAVRMCTTLKCSSLIITILLILQTLFCTMTNKCTIIS